MAPTRGPFAPPTFQAWAAAQAHAGAAVTTRATTLGLLLTGTDPADPARLAGDLVAALAPLPDRYPMPYVAP